MKNGVPDYLHRTWRHTHFGFLFEVVRGPRKGLYIITCISSTVNGIYRFIVCWGVGKQEFVMSEAISVLLVYPRKRQDFKH